MGHVENQGEGGHQVPLWAMATVLVFAYAIHFYQSGTMVHWYYYKAKADGFAVNTKMFKDASPEIPAVLTSATSRPWMG